MKTYQGNIPKLKTWHKKLIGFSVFILWSLITLIAAFLIDKLKRGQ